MKKRIFALLLFALMLTMAACSSAPAEPEEEVPPIVGNYYLGKEYTRSVKLPSMITILFKEDQTVQIVDSGLEMAGDKRISHYGAYTVAGSTFTIKIGSEEYTGIIQNEGETIMIGSNEFSLVEPEGLSEKTRAAFE